MSQLGSENHVVWHIHSKIVIVFDSFHSKHSFQRGDLGGRAMHQDIVYIIDHKGNVSGAVDGHALLDWNKVLPLYAR
jgi:hypothetical protein